jgi:hypothetical protein
VREEAVKTVAKNQQIIIKELGTICAFLKFFINSLVNCFQEGKYKIAFFLCLLPGVRQ